MPTPTLEGIIERLLHALVTGPSSTSTS